MNEKLRRGYGFTLADKLRLRNEVDGACQFPQGCLIPNTGRVNHITGVFEARLDNKDKASVGNIELNGIMLCLMHEAHHDIQEKYQIECLIWERRHNKRKKK